MSTDFVSRNRGESWCHFHCFLRYATRERSVFVISAGSVTLFLCAIVFLANDLNTNVWRAISCSIELVTLGVAVLVWLGELRQDWHEQLPKRLDVVFEFEGKPLLVCLGLPLSGEGDIRQLAQQVGRQMTGGRLLSLDMFLTQSGPILRTNDRGEIRRWYGVTYRITEMPQPRNPAQSNNIENQNDGSVNFQQLADDNNCLLWTQGKHHQTAETIVTVKSGVMDSSIAKIR